ncbi:EEF1A lysine methyltransferase 4 isoform 2-T2 [Mantella aurantiaca]
MYKESGYWDARYERERELSAAGGHEWFGHYPDFAHLVRRQLRPGLRALVLGCGTSSLSADLYAEGVSPIISIDYSPICIKEMTEKNACIPEMSWLVMDARQLQFPDESFDLVIEKGTLDSMMVDEKDPWNITPETVNLVDEVLSEYLHYSACNREYSKWLVGFSPPVDASSRSHSPLLIFGPDIMHSLNMIGLCHVIPMEETSITFCILC